jgi:hypothetical protein
VKRKRPRLCSVCRRPARWAVVYDRPFVVVAGDASVKRRGMETITYAYRCKKHYDHLKVVRVTLALAMMVAPAGNDGEQGESGSTPHPGLPHHQLDPSGAQYDVHRGGLAFS